MSSEFLFWFFVVSQLADIIVTLLWRKTRGVNAANLRMYGRRPAALRLIGLKTAFCVALWWISYPWYDFSISPNPSLDSVYLFNLGYAIVVVALSVYAWKCACCNFVTIISQRKINTYQDSL